MIEGTPQPLGGEQIEERDKRPPSAMSRKAAAVNSRYPHEAPTRAKTMPENSTNPPQRTFCRLREPGHVVTGGIIYLHRLIRDETHRLRFASEAEAPPARGLAGL